MPVGLSLFLLEDTVEHGEDSLLLGLGDAPDALELWGWARVRRGGRWRRPRGHPWRRSSARGSVGWGRACTTSREAWSLRIGGTYDALNRPMSLTAEGVRAPFSTTRWAGGTVPSRRIRLGLRWG